MVTPAFSTRLGRAAALVIAASVLVYLAFTWVRVWRQRTHIPAEVAYRSDVESAFSNLSIDLIGPALSDGSVTSITQLKLECSRRYPSALPVFKVYELSDVKNGEYPQYGLPARDYFWLRDWSSNDSRSTPLIWSYFHPPWGIDVVYLAIDGSAHHCSSNEFASLVAPVSNRVEQAALTR
jgi:hypothetical protein